MDVVYPRNAGLNPIADENLTISTLAIAIAHAVGTLTVAIQPTDGDTFTIDGKVYTLQTTLTNVDGNIQIGAAVANTQANILAAINLTGTPGTDYAATMTLHPTVYAAEAWIGNDLAITAKAAGTAGNALATTETFTSGSNVFDAATLGTTNAGLTQAATRRRSSSSNNRASPLRRRVLDAGSRRTGRCPPRTRGRHRLGHLGPVLRIET
jgi:hypothetical protein